MTPLPIMHFHTIRFLRRVFVVLASVLALIPTGWTSAARAAEPVEAAGLSQPGSGQRTSGPPGASKEFDSSDVQKAAGPSESRSLEVVATGIGTDPQSAEQNALVGAIEQVVGMLVDAETIVSNDRIVRDQVLTYSRGFVENHKPIDRWQKGGLHYVRVRALVSATRLGEKLKAQNVVLREIDGDKIAIRFKVEELQEERGKQMFRKAVADFTPDKMLTVSLADEKPTFERTPNGVKVTVPYRLDANLEAWKAIRSNLVPLLDRLSPGKRSGSFMAEQGFTFSGARPKGDLLYLFKQMGPDGIATDWEEYQLPHWLMPDMQNVAARQSTRFVGGVSEYEGCAVTLSLLDGQNRVIAKTSRFFPTQNIRYMHPIVPHYLVFAFRPQGTRDYSMGPLLFDGRVFRQGIQLSETFTLAPDQVARVKRYGASIEARRRP